MLHNIIRITEQHKQAAQTILDHVEDVLKNKYVISISGEVGSGKYTTAYCLARRLKALGYNSKLIHMDDLYKIPPDKRKGWRRKKGIEHVGYDEYNWDLILKIMDDFRNDKQSEIPSVDLITNYVDTLITDFKGIDVLILHGLYSVLLDDADLKVFIENTFEETSEAQIQSGKEELDEFRMQVLKKEHEVVQSLKSKAEFYVDFSNNADSYHL